VPFELGRPLGVPNDPAFQTDVLRATLALLERESGPVLEDYPHEAPASEGEVWACPVALPGADAGDDQEQRLLREIKLLRPWYEETLRSRGRSAVGLSGVKEIETIASYVAGYVSGEPGPLPEGARERMPLLVRHMADDLKAFYLEAAIAQPGRAATSEALNEWLYQETTLGETLYDLRDRLAAAEDPREKVFAAMIIPVMYGRRPES
jgi:hypothetical protein